MIKRSFFLIEIFLMVISISWSQDYDTVKLVVPLNVTLKSLDGKNISSSEIKNDGKPFVLIFWKSCCTPNITMLDEISEVYADWKNETGVEIFAVSIDDVRSSNKISSLINSKEWEFKVLLDPNSDFKRTINVIATPHVFIFDKSGNCFWQKTTYNPGDISEIYKLIKNQQ